MKTDRTNRFDKAFGSKPNDQQAAVSRAIKLLLDNPRHPSLRVKGVTGWPGVFSARVKRGPRISFEWGAEGQIVLRNNCHHEDVYRRP